MVCLHKYGSSYIVDRYVSEISIIQTNTPSRTKNNQARNKKMHDRFTWFLNWVGYILGSHQLSIIQWKKREQTAYSRHIYSRVKACHRHRSAKPNRIRLHKHDTTYIDTHTHTLDEYQLGAYPAERGFFQRLLIKTKQSKAKLEKKKKKNSWHEFGGCSVVQTIKNIDFLQVKSNTRYLISGLKPTLVTSNSTEDKKKLGSWFSRKLWILHILHRTYVSEIQSLQTREKRLLRTQTKEELYRSNFIGCPPRNNQGRTWRPNNQK